jgi:phosphoribosyl 1,2-cyclic phosphate phosphodiesterase
MDDIRAYNFFQQKAMDIYATPETQSVIRREFSYIFDNPDYPGIPQVNMHQMANEPFEINGLQIVPVRVLHYRLEVFGFRIGDFTYITDANYIAPEELEKIKGSKVLVLNALRHEPHISHFTLEEAVAVARETGAAQTYFTHISHQLGLHQVLNQHLPAGMALAYDGMVLDL